MCGMFMDATFYCGSNDTIVDTAEQLIADVVDTGDKHSFANISANFLKTSKRPQQNTWGPGGD
jgi:hypothetical protein